MVDTLLKRVLNNVLYGFKKATNLIFSSVEMIITVLVFSLVLHFVPFWLVFIALIITLGVHVYNVYLELMKDDD